MKSADASAVPVLRPKLPDAEALMPYLRRIDETRVYSNQGPLSIEFEGRVATTLGLPVDGFIAAASGTAALCAAILAVAGRAREERPLAMLPAFSFIATASAVEQCGYVPYLIDVDEQTWALDPTLLARHPSLDRVGVIIPVAPFGRPLRQDQWRAFQERTSIPIVLDGAASFDVCAASAFLGDLPVAMSFNATKSFATAEGGGVATTDNELRVRIRRALNFGFFLTRESRSASFNGKMSEYHAAIGLAELDGWSAKHGALMRVSDLYRRSADAKGISHRIISYPDVSSSYVLYGASNGKEAARAEDALRLEAIGTRRWYGLGLHREPYLSSCARDSLEKTDRIAATVLGIPVAPDLPEAVVNRVVGLLAQSDSG